MTPTNNIILSNHSLLTANNVIVANILKVDQNKDMTKQIKIIFHMKFHTPTIIPSKG